MRFNLITWAKGIFYNNSKSSLKAVNVQEAVDELSSVVSGKQATITGGATSITNKDLTANRVVVSNANGKVAVSSVTSAEVYQLSGINTDKNIQGQLNSKADNNVVGNQSALPLSSSTFAYNIYQNAENIKKNAQNIESNKTELESQIQKTTGNIASEVGAQLGALNTKIFEGCYGSLSSAMSAINVSFASGTTAEFFDALPIGATIKFMTQPNYITDLPVAYGTLDVIKGRSEQNFRYIICHGTDGTIWAYKWHSTGTAGNGWEKIAKGTPSYLTLTPASNVTATSTCKYWKNAFNEIHFNLSLQAKSDIANGATIATLPSGYRPTGYFQFPVTAKGATTQSWTVGVNTDGTIVLHGATSLPSGTSFTASGVVL